MESASLAPVTVPIFLSRCMFGDYRRDRWLRDPCGTRYGCLGNTSAGCGHDASNVGVIVVAARTGHSLQVTKHGLLGRVDGARFTWHQFALVRR